MSEKKEVKKEENVTRESTQEPTQVKTKKSKLKWVIIAIIIILVIIGAGIGGYFAYQKYEETKTTGSQWGDIYYNYLKSAVDENSNEADYGLEDNMQNSKIQFIETDEEMPTMVMTYNLEEDTYLNIYKVNDEETAEKVVTNKEGTVEFLYNIEEKTYDWYVHSEEEEKDVYVKVENIENSSKNIEIKKDEKTEQKTVSGDTITLTKYDETFMKPEIETDAIDFIENIELRDLRKEIETTVTEYKTTEEIVTEEIKTAVEKKVQEVETTKKQMETAKEEIEEEEKKKEEEEAKKKAEEEAKKGLKVGKYTIKYGTYKTDAAQMGGDYYGTLELKQNGVFHIKSNCDVSSTGAGYKKIDCSGTYKVSKIQNSFEYFDGLVFTTKVQVINLNLKHMLIQMEIRI